MRVLVDNRIRIKQSDLPEEVQARLKTEFTHHNPVYHKRVALGYYPSRNEPPSIKTWKEEHGCLTFPRGGMERVRNALRDASLPYSTVDARVSPQEDHAGFTWPAHRITLRPDQETVVKAMRERENCLIRSGTGCIAGSTIIGVNQGGISREYSLRDLVTGFNAGRIPASTRSWDASIPTRIRVRGEDGFVRLHRLAAAYSSGVKQTFELETESGRRIRATTDHRFLSKSGWKRLGALREGDLIFVDGGPPKPGLDARARGKRKNYLVFGGLYDHPFVTRVKGRVPKHRIIAEARLNGLDLADFLVRIRKGKTEGLRFIDPSEWTVHHRDEDSMNNDPDNLEVIPRLDHYAHHGREGGWKHVTARTVLERIVSIREWGLELTYDLAMEGEPRNFIANGFVVHNSGKTCSAIALIARLQLPTIVVVWNTRLFDQWVTRLKSELGMDERWIGKVRGGKRVIGPITVAMQQTVARIKDPAFYKRFAVLIFDEVQKAAAKTYYASVDPFHSRYRIGISADEKRKDGKQFLTNDLFGEVAAEVDHDDLVRGGAILDVRVRVVLSDFVAPWYDPATADHTDYTRLLAEMAVDADRNALILSETKRLVDQGRKCILFGRRREHCREIDSQLAAMGIRTGLLIGGEDYRTAYEETRDGLGTGRLDAGVGTIEAVGTGIDIPKISGGVAMAPLAANKQLFGQVRGRLCRTAPGKADAELVYVWDRLIFPHHLRNLAAWANEVWIDENGTSCLADEYLRAMRRP